MGYRKQMLEGKKIRVKTSKETNQVEEATKLLGENRKGKEFNKLLKIY